MCNIDIYDDHLIGDVICLATRKYSMSQSGSGSLLEFKLKLKKKEKNRCREAIVIKIVGL